MNRLVKRIQECTTIADVDNLGIKLRPTFRKTLETAIMLKNNPDVNQRNIGMQFMRTCIQEAERGADAITAPTSADGLKTKGDGFVQEEELDNHNPESGNKGSEQSSDNVEPYPAEGKDAPNSDIESMQTASGEDQMKEGFPMPGGFPPTGIEPRCSK